MSEVTLEQILTRREQRAAYQKELINKFKCPLISFMVNMPGPIKTTPLTARVHSAGMRALADALPKDKIKRSEVLLLPTGAEGFVCVSMPAKELKLITIKLECSLAYGRLLDFDVFDTDKKQISRTELGFGQRACMVCQKPGAACASRRLHKLSEIIAAFERLARLA